MNAMRAAAGVRTGVSSLTSGVVAPSQCVETVCVPVESWAAGQIRELR